MLSSFDLLFAFMKIWPIFARSWFVFVVVFVIVFVIAGWFLNLLTLSCSDLLFAFMIIRPILAGPADTALSAGYREVSSFLCAFSIQACQQIFFVNLVNACQESHMSFRLASCLGVLTGDMERSNHAQSPITSPLSPVHIIWLTHLSKALYIPPYVF